MDVTVSIPGPLVDAADRLARSRGWSRSELFIRALELVLAGDAVDEEVTAQLDDVYTVESSALDPSLAAAQRAAIEDRW
ncbi:MAG: ribbon-helix-helix domain-containing protein [Actinomycetota bacterium]|nr:ribbon-helix-helix domain-containing protein [Actinomycetota bacterium]